MTNATKAQSLEVKRCANDISAHLARVAKNPPDLTEYLKVHADCVSKALLPRGFVYEMLNGSRFQRVIGHSLEDIDFRDFPEQEESFRKVIRKVAKENRPALVEPRSVPTGAESMRGLDIKDTPAPERLPFFNQTAFQHIFVPIPLEDKVVGVLQAWFSGSDSELGQTRLAVLQSGCRDIELYLKTRKLTDLTQELTRLTTYVHLLEDLAGDLDLESTIWNLVNFARETVSCDRVSIFTVSNYRAVHWKERIDPEELEFEISATSGLKKPHPRSEHAEILKGLVKRLFLHTVPEGKGNTINLPAAEEAKRIEEPSRDKIISKGGERDGESAESASREAGKPLLPARDAPPPKMRLALVERDPAKEETRAGEINLYFEIIPMNWATVLPLFDRENGICGILLFEGREQARQVQSAFPRMKDLSLSGGRALGTALYWQQDRPLAMARYWNGLKERALATPPRKWFWKAGAPLLVVAFILLFPITYKIKGDATVIPKEFRSLPALVPARLTEVLVREGTAVKRGQVLARLDTGDIEIQLLQARQEFERYMTEADSALSKGDETAMQIARIRARKVAAAIDKYAGDLKKATLRAPFDGVVVGPQNLPQQVGRVMQMGEPVVEVAQPKNWVVKIEVREQDLVSLDDRLRSHGMIPGEMKLKADPARTYPLRITKASQFAYGLQTNNGKYTFEILLPLELDSSDLDFLKVGFAGKVSFQSGYKPVAFILFHDFIRFLKLKWL